MPAVSKKQRIAMAIAEHEPSKLYSRNKGLAKMSKADLHDFASTPEHGLPLRKTMSHGNRAMRDRSTSASPPMSIKEICRGYRKVG